MVISNLNIPRMLELLRFIETCLGELRPFSTMPLPQFLSDKRNAPCVESYLRRGIEAVFDIGRYILAKTCGFKEIEYKAIAKALGEKDVVTKELADILYIMAGYRNRLVHFYREVTSEELHRIVAKNLPDFDKFVKEIVAFIRAYEQKIQGK